jgi:glycosyltransferase involved in cell wall biosynthesis
MERHGWRMRHSLEVSATPELYRSYIQRSRGEISCVKPSCVRLQNGWVSDRSLCYLASGKPVVVQRTGLSSYLPTGEGILQFSSPTEAAEALAAVNAGYERHCRSAREIAETYFDARQTTAKILDVALR